MLDKSYSRESTRPGLDTLQPWYQSLDKTYPFYYTGERLS